MLGKGSSYAAECIKEGFIGVGWFEDIDLTSILSRAADWRAFNKEMIPIYLKNHPEKKKVSAVLS